MNKFFVLCRNFTLGILGASLGLGGCGLFGGGAGDMGELRGAPGREGWVMTVPFGTVPIPAGTFHMGQADEDPAATQINYNKQITIGNFYMDETEITNNKYRQFTDFFIPNENADYNTNYHSVTKDEIRSILENVQEKYPTFRMDLEMFDVSDDEFMENYFPNMEVWVRDFSHHMGDPLQDYYYWHPGYDDYPVVGVSWKAAKFFSEWRTAYLNAYRDQLGEFPMPKFRLPSEAEWEYAARGGRDLAKYPWGNPYIRNSKGCMLANFKPGRGNYYDDGFAYTAPVESYFPNDFGLFDMAGNVSEWCEDAFFPASVPVVWDLNPTYNDENEPRKVIRGGSWKDVAYYLETGTRTYEFQDSVRAYIGFRNAMTQLGRSSGTEF